MKKVTGEEQQMLVNLRNANAWQALKALMATLTELTLENDFKLSPEDPDLATKHAFNKGTYYAYAALVSKVESLKLKEDENDTPRQN